MIFIVVKFEAKDEYVERWPELVAEFTEATRQEPGNKWFEWSRSLDNPHEYVLVEAFEEDAAEAHVNSEHFRKMTEQFPQYLVKTPRIISRQIEGDGWEEMGEVQVTN
ncbi:MULTISPECIES: putative quinol monooxygenase [Kocuria]|uniref:putative quinol monooxygenase n=1 Tax=Kocuria TaxID=57493 RepID=UPI0021A4DAF0|nr:MULTISPECIES: putative quinol monooxygenase [Kocuria]MCT1545768.1 antibiotic biosynthesis monooxygenase [Kocuria rhizophila]MCT2172301.1 antibiotic biosynthesis monooxygenase [Kocuria rhizophila]MDN3462839.1 putative quinol monooxygenase [Kocuria sp. APC 4018]